jgi:hypothetical protein
MKHLALAVLVASAAVLAAEPPAMVDVAVPEYQVTRQGGADYVTIPGGQMLVVEQGRPMVPYLVRSVNYPSGYMVQSVRLKRKAAARTQTGLKLPAVILDDTPRTQITMKPGLYPAQDFDWKLWQSLEGGNDLVLSVYPFRYDPATGAATFCPDYQFEVKYVRSDISIAGLETDSFAYHPRSRTTVTARLKNAGRAKDIAVSMNVAVKGTTGQGAAVRSQRLRVLPGDTAVTLGWQSADGTAGDYSAEVFVRDGTGNLLDHRQVDFRLGVPAGDVSSFTATPEQFRIGESVLLGLGFRNTGSCPLDGECAFRIVSGGEDIRQTRWPFTGLGPGQTLAASDTWTTSQAEKGAVYYAIGHVSYTGGATPCQQILLSTNRMPEAAFTVAPEQPAAGNNVTFDASGSTDADGRIAEYRWEFGDGAKSLGVKARHRFELPGTYEVKLTVTDNEHGSGTATRAVVVRE